MLCVCVSPSRLPLRGMTISVPRPPPMTLWGRRSGGFLKEPVYWWRNEWTLWADGGRPFLTMGSVEADTVIKWQQKLTIWMWMHNALADSAYEPEFYGDKEAAFESVTSWPTHNHLWLKMVSFTHKDLFITEFLLLTFVCHSPTSEN